MSEKISRGKKAHCLLQFTICAALAVLCPGQTITVLLDAYSLTSTLTDNSSTLPLGTTVILTCRTAGIPQGTDYSYTWSCPGTGSCNIGQGRNPNRKTYEDRLVLHILSTADKGTYTCSVGLATGEVLGMDQFEFTVEGGLVLHHGSNLIANNELITDVQGITSDGITSISCTTTDQQQPQWRGPNGEITSNDTSLPLYVIPSSNTAILIINSNNIINFTNAEFTCNTTQHAARVNLYFGPGGTLQTPTLSGEPNATHTLIRLPSADRVIFSYERQDFNLPLQVEYQEVEGIPPGTAITKPVIVPGVKYKIVLWAVDGNQYSSQPSSASTYLQIGQAPSAPRSLTVTRTFTSDLELNWIPSKETNAVNIRYEIQYGLNTSDYTTVDTNGSDTYHNLTELLQNTTYYIRVVAVNYITASGVARTEGEWITATVMMSSPHSSTTQHTVSPSATISTNSTTLTTVSPPTNTLTIGIAAGVGGGVVLILIIVILVVVMVCLVVRRRGGKEKQHPPPAYYNTPGEGEKDEGVLIIANEPEVQYTYIRKESLEKTGSLHSSHSSIHNTISNEHAENGTAEQQNQNTGPVEYASIEEIRRSTTPNTPPLQEYATIDSNTRPPNSGPPVAIGGEYATVSDHPSGMEYSTIGELPAQEQTAVAQNNPNTSTLPQMRSQAVLAREGNDSVVDAVAGRPLPDPSYDAIDNNQSTPQPASAYDTVDNNLPPSGGTEYESVPERPPIRNEGYERIENGGGNNITVPASASRPTGGYETIDDSDQPVVLGNGTYELVDTGGTPPTNTTSGQEQQSSTDNLLDEGLYAGMSSESNKPSSPNNNNSTEADVSNKTSVAPLSKNQADELYSTPDMTRKPKKKSSEDPSPKEEEYAPAVPGFNPDILYAQPDKNKKLSEDPAPKEEDFYATIAPGFNPDILYAQPDKNKKLSEDPAPKEEEYAPTVPGFNSPDILYAQPDKNKKLSEDPAPKEEEYAPTIPEFNPDILYAQPDKNKKLREDPAPKEEEYAPTVPEFNPDILYAQPDKNKKLREDPAPKEEDLYATIAGP